jgi:GNAT superfamily N-acetyltransferase
MPKVPEEQRVLRPLVKGDFGTARRLYVELVGDSSVPDGRVGEDHFARVLHHPGTTVWGALLAGEVVSMATLHILPNVTFGGRPYCVVENVATSQLHRGQGHGAAVMRRVIEAAWAADAYKVMLLTGKTRDARGFYEKLGFSHEDKYGMTLWQIPA